MMTEDLDGRETLLDRALAIETDAHQQDLLIALGNVAMNRREMDRAEALFHRAHEMDPRSQAGLNALFDFYHRSGRHDAALAEAKRLVREDPEFPPYVGHWAAAAIVKGDPAETTPALEAFDAAIMRDPEDPGPMRTMGPMVIDARLRTEDYARAEELLLRGLDVVDPAASGALYNRLGWVALELAKPADAEEWFRRAYDRSIMKEGALAGLFQSALIRNEYDRAREHADKLDDLSRGKPWTRAMQIEVDIRAGRQREADKRTRETLEQIDDERERRMFLRELSEAYLAAGRFEQAVELGRQAKALEPEDRPDGTTAVLLAWSLMNLDRAEEAGEVIQSATEEVPEDVRLDLLASFNALMAGEAELAEQRATKILEQGPAIASAHVALGYALGRQGRFAEAMPHAERALEMRPDRTSRTLAAWVLIAGGIDLDRGLEMAMTAVDTPDSYLQAAREISCVALAEHCLGIAYLKQGRYDEAVEVLTEASRIRPDHALIREQLEQATAMSMQSGS
jgi:tetratricopeptide (TPR) repeat protein